MNSESPELLLPTGKLLFPCMEQANGNRKYTNGAVGSLLHAIALHGVNYSIELQVYADGVSPPCPCYMIIADD
jgi:hypothetical protein